MFKISSVSMRIAIYFGLLTLAICAGLGLLAYNNGSSAVMAEVELALKMQAEQASEFLQSRFETHLAVLETIACFLQEVFPQNCK